MVCSCWRVQDGIGQFEGTYWQKFLNKLFLLCGYTFKYLLCLCTYLCKIKNQSRWMSCDTIVANFLYATVIQTHLNELYAVIEYIRLMEHVKALSTLSTLSLWNWKASRKDIPEFRENRYESNWIISYKLIIW